MYIHCLVHKTMLSDASKTKNRILDAANRLFYADGIRAVSADAVAEKAGITKRMLYYHFPSKDDLVARYQESRDQPNLAAFRKWFEAADGTAADQTRAIFDSVAQASKRPSRRGCGFLRTAAELANLPGHPAIRIGAAHKKKFEAWLASVYVAANATEPEQLARQVVLIMDGAFSTMLVHRDTGYIQSAGDAAAALVTAALAPQKRKAIAPVLSHPSLNCRLWN